MRKLNDFASDQNKERIRQAVLEAEKKTAAEIVPMIVHSSTGAEHVWPMLTALLLTPATILFLKIDLFQFHPLRPWMIMAALLLACVVLGWLGSRLEKIQMWLTHVAQERRDVERRALFEFYGLKMDKTVGQTGILLFVSLKERRAVVLGDRIVAEKLPASTWNTVIEKLVTVARKDSLEGLIEAIHECGRIAGEHFPRSPNDKNELSDLLIVKR